MSELQFWKRQFTNPIRHLTPERLSRQIDAYESGYFADFAITAEAMENRDDILKNVITKRKKAVTRHGWEILTENNSPEARQQREALDFFYRNLTCSHAIRKSERGGFQLFIYQMMDAVAKGYAVHEIAWQPVLRRGSRIPRAAYGVPPNARISTISAESSAFMSAHFQFVPLWYFEAATGELRFLRSISAATGEQLAEREWLITVGDALMIACSRAFLFKHQPLQAWLDYTKQFGFPGIRGTTSAARGTPEFEQMEETLASFMKQLSAVTTNSESIDVLDLKGHSQQPFAELVERMDRVMASLWRGADLSTISRDRGYGASLQDKEAQLLEEDDARTLSEHLNATVDRWVLEMLLGRDAERLARVKILVTPEERTPEDLAVDQFLVQHGARLSITESLERYGRAEAKPGEPALSIGGERVAPARSRLPRDGSGKSSRKNAQRPAQERRYQSYGKSNLSSNSNYRNSHLLEQE
jgi:hypothetical protein